MIFFQLEIVNKFGILMIPMDGEMCFIIYHLCYGIFKNIFQLSCLIFFFYSFFEYFSISFCYTIAKRLAMCWLGEMITTQKEHILNKNFHEFHTF